METAVVGRNSFGTIKREDLGRKTIENFEALGSREILTVNPKAESTLKEFWFSPQLDVNLVTMRFEPRGGSEIFYGRRPKPQ